jgi:hypothetical protein
MNAIGERIINVLAAFFGKAWYRRFLYLLILCIFALAEYYHTALTRTTFVFYSINNGTPAVEERMLPLPRSREEKVAGYVEETLLGPVSQDSTPLFSRDTRLESLLYRDGVVYLDLSEAAALPPERGGDVFRSLETLHRGILRNFSFVRKVRLFIAGNEALSEKNSEKNNVNRRKNGNSA